MITSKIYSLKQLSNVQYSITDYSNNAIVTIIIVTIHYHFHKLKWLHDILISTFILNLTLLPSSTFKFFILKKLSLTLLSALPIGGWNFLNHSLRTLCLYFLVFQSYMELVFHLYQQTKNIKVIYDIPNDLLSALWFFDFFVWLMWLTILLQLSLILDFQNILLS